MDGGSVDYAHDVVYGGTRLFVTGEFECQIAFRGTFPDGSTRRHLTARGDSDSYVAAMHPSTGATLWATQLGGPVADFGQSVAYGENKVFASGAFGGGAIMGAVDRDPVINLTASGDGDLNNNLNGYVTALDESTGHVLWAVRVGSNTVEAEVRYVCLGFGNGRLYVAGWYKEGPVSFSSGNTPFGKMGESDAFVTALDPNNGSFLWGKALGGTHDDRAYGVTYGLGQVFVTGYHKSSPSTFGDGVVLNAWSTSYPSAFIAAFHSENGTSIWAEAGGSGGGADQHISYDVAYGDSTVFFTGHLQGNMIFSDGWTLTNYITNGNSRKDAFVAALDAKTGLHPIHPIYIQYASNI